VEVPKVQLVAVTSGLHLRQRSNGLLAFALKQ